MAVPTHIAKGSDDCVLSGVLEQQMEHVLGRVEDMAGKVDDLPAHIRGAVSEGVQAGIKALASDPEFGARFWRAGFEHMSEHAGRASSQWVGQRLLTAMVIAVVSAGIAWLVKSGKI